MSCLVEVASLLDMLTQPNELLLLPSRGDAEQFRLEVIQAKAHTVPVRHVGETHFVYVKHQNIYVVALTSVSISCLICFSVLRVFSPCCCCL